MKRLAVLAVLVLAAALTPAAAVASVSVTYVEDHTSSAWPVASAYAWVDQYTGSDWVYGSCRAGHRCHKVYQRYFTGTGGFSTSWAAITYRYANSYYGSGYSLTITWLNQYRAGQPYSWRWRYVAHELVHAGGYWTHWPYCNDLMYYRIPCWGTTLPPIYLHSAVRTALAAG
jgi:hypothetical protein